MPICGINRRNGMKNKGGIIMYKFISVNIYDRKECREFEALLNQGWEIKQFQAVRSVEGVVVAVAVLYRAK